MNGKEFREEFHKALTSAVGGQLNNADFNQFISSLKDESPLLGRLRFMPMKSNIQEIHVLSIASGQGQIGTEDTQETTASFTLPVNTITAGEIVVDAPVTYQFLEDQVWSSADGPDGLAGAIDEGLSLIQDELVKYTANEIAREAASTASAGFTDSIIDIVTQDALVVDIDIPATGSSNLLSGSMRSFFASASLGQNEGLALKAQESPGDFEYVVSRNHATQYRRELEDLAVDQGFSATVDGINLKYNDIPVRWYPNWPDRHIMLSKLGADGDIVWGVRKNVTMESDRNINLRRFDNVLSARSGFGLANSADVVLIHFIG